MIYRTYCDKIPEQLEDITDSFCNKPRGGLWGCRGNEWKNWCKAEQYNLRCLKKVFYWKLTEDVKLYTMRTEQDYLYIVEKYGNTRQDSIDYMLMKQDYDAIEVVGDIVYELRYGTQSTGRRFIDLMGLYAWDVPSICVMNTDKVIRTGNNVKERN
jgi:hypothetical protein